MNKKQALEIKCESKRTNIWEGRIIFIVKISKKEQTGRECENAGKQKVDVCFRWAGFVLIIT